MRIGICTNPEKIVATMAGLDYIEGSVPDLLCPREGEEKFAARLAALGAAKAPVEAANLFIPPDLKCTGPAANDEALDAFVATVMARAAKVGLRTIVFGSGGSRNVPDGFDRAQAADQLVAHMKRWGPLAAKASVTIALEPLFDSNIVTTLAEGAGLVGRVNHPSIRLLCDTFHMIKQNDPPEAIRAAKGLIAHVHVAEGDGRGPLGAVGEDQRAYFRALKDIGYSGRVSIEATWKDFDKQLAPAVMELKKQIETA